MKKTILQINTVCGIGSTGRIAVDIDNTIDKNRYNMYIAYGYGKSERENTIKIGTKLDYIIHNILSRLTGRQGRYSWFATNRFLKKVDKINPDLIHLHNIHGNYINYKLLFKYIKNKQIPVVWTFHDAWPITGKCTHFDYINCDKWKNGCCNCSNLKEYPMCFVDNSKKEYLEKKKEFTEVKKLYVVTPSNWMAELVRKSFLREKNIRVINNGIDLNKFKYIKDEKTLKKYGKFEKKIVLGVANDWNKKKGLDTFIELAKSLPEEYQIIMVGLEENQFEMIPNNVIKVKKTSSIDELAKLYSIADVFVNPTLEDNFPTTNIEAIACGTPVITYNTGGSGEMLDDKTGIVIEKGNIEALKKELYNIKKKKSENKDCVIRAQKYNKNQIFLQYEKLYDEILKEKK